MTEMATECVKVKKEPVDLPDEAENGSQLPPPDYRSGPEFVNIKMELDVPDKDTRLKPEGAGNAAQSANDAGSSWEVPLNDADPILPNSYVEISIKVEPDDQYCPSTDDDPSSSQWIPTNGQQGSHNPQDDAFVCRICFKRFANPGNVQRHMLIHTKERFNCTECPRQFFSKEQLEKHMHRHRLKEVERAYGCEHCDKRFKSSSNLQQHKKVHMVKPYFCTQCHRSFAFKANLTKHQGKSRCTRPIDEPLQCHVCQKTFKKTFLLKSHLRRHDTERPFACDQCDMKFKYKSTLIRHVQLHNGIRPFACPVCDKTFTHSGLLKPHMRVHTGEKPYQCPVCSKYFAHKHNMQRHAIGHNKVKHLVCDICHKQFPKESRLKYHMKTHVNEKHFSCNICPKKFSHKQNVLRHYSRKHPSAKYVCTDTDASVALKVWDTIKSKYSEDAGEILG